jgi:phosphatidate phosphatase APP1
MAYYKLASKKMKASVKVYHGYGHTHNMHVFGHVFSKLPPPRNKNRNSLLYNILHLVELFRIKPLPRVPVSLHTGDKELKGTTEDDGFFRFDWQASHEIKAGWHPVLVSTFAQNGDIANKAEGRIFIPHSTQYGFISDIDDTIMVSHSAKTHKKLRQLFIKSPLKRSLFADVALHYELLAAAHTTPDVPNPFFYVSSSEWNLYDYLHEVFSYNKLPEGVFLLNQVKRWFQLWKTGKNGHESKLLRILRIFDAFPKQQFVLLGDNSQSDPEIYAMLAQRKPGKIHAVYIRNVIPGNEAAARQTLDPLKEAGIAVCFFKESKEAIKHSREIGLIGK